ncbi:putative amino acid transporter, transmembrane domain-containing protein [Dioscorea sansibarensis]
MFCAPVHEALDTKFLRLDENMFSKNNLLRRFILRSMVFGINTLIAALFPFMGDFVNLFGSFTLCPLTFVFPSMIFIKVRRKRSNGVEKVWHWSNIVIFSLLSIVTTASAVRIIINNVRIYHFFADT